MSHNQEDFSRASAGKRDRIALNKQLYAVIESLNRDLDELRSANNDLAESNELAVLHGLDWIRIWNNRRGLQRFDCEEKVVAARKRWQSTLDGYKSHETDGLRKLKRILKLGADPNVDNGRPLYLACKHGNVSLITALHAAGASLERRTAWFCTNWGDPLHATWACRANHVEAARLLIQLGCKPCDEDVYWARQHESYGVEKFLGELGFKERVPRRTRTCPWDFGPR